MGWVKKFGIGNLIIILILLLLVPLLSFISLKEDSFVHLRIIKNNLPSNETINQIIANLTYNTNDTIKIAKRTSQFVNATITTKLWDDKINFCNFKSLYRNLDTCLIKKYPCIRLYKKESSLYLLNSRCGACGEHALLYSYLMELMNISAPRLALQREGGGHELNELTVNGEIIIVDSADNNFDEPREDEMYPNKKIYYVEKRYPNGTKVDYTKTYAKDTFGNITLKFTFLGKPLRNYPIIFSYKYPILKFTDNEGYIVDGLVGNYTYKIQYAGYLSFLSGYIKKDEINITSNQETKENIKIKINYLIFYLTLIFATILGILVSIKLRKIIEQKKQF